MTEEEQSASMTDTRIDGDTEQDIRSVRPGDQVLVKCRAIRTDDAGLGKVVFQIVHLALLGRA